MAISYDSIPKEEYPANLYQPDAIVQPIKGLGSFDGAMLAQYHELGFVSVADAISPEDVDEVLEALLEVAMDPDAKGAELQFEHDAKGKIDSLPRDEYLDYIRKYMWFSHLHPATEALMYRTDLVRILEQILGGEVEMFQDMALLKPPGIGREKPWHQDHAYFNLPAGTKVVGVWIALDDATPENGCMHFMPGQHKQGPVPHWNRRDWQICDSEILSQTGQVATPLNAGGCVIFDGLTPHGTPDNRTQTRRRAIQWHYLLKGTPRISTEERLAIFGSEGRNVSC